MREVIELEEAEEAVSELSDKLAEEDKFAASREEERRSGEMRRFAINCALQAAWRTEFCIPHNQDFSYLDYFEAAASRNLGLLRGFKKLGEYTQQRGILPQEDSPQARLVTDGGRTDDGRPVDVCDECGDALAYVANELAGGEYCDICYDRKVSML